MLGTKHPFLSFSGETTCYLKFLLNPGSFFFMKKKDTNKHVPVGYAIVSRKDTGRGNLVTEIRYAASHELQMPTVCWCAGVGVVEIHDKSDKAIVRTYIMRIYVGTIHRS